MIMEMHHWLKKHKILIPQKTFSFWSSLYNLRAKGNGLTSIAQKAERCKRNISTCSNTIKNIKYCFDNNNIALLKKPTWFKKYIGS